MKVLFAMAIILIFPIVARAQTPTFEQQVQHVIDGFRSSAAISREVKSSSCHQWTEPSKQEACERACDAASAFGEYLALTVPDLIRSHEADAIKQLGELHQRLLAEQRKYDKSAGKLTKR